MSRSARRPTIGVPGGSPRSVEQVLAAARGEPHRLDRPLQIERPSGRRALLVQVAPLPAPSFSPWDAVDSGARVIVRPTADPHASIQAQAEQLGLLVGFTGAEARVAAALGTGLGLAQRPRVPLACL